MTHGFIVMDFSGYLKDYADAYLEIREQMFGYAKTFPELVVPKGKDDATGVEMVHLQNAQLGLLKSYDEALALQKQLITKFPKRDLRIWCIEYKDAHHIQWYTNNSIVTNE